MPILLDNSSKVLFQGDLSERTLYHVQQCLAYGTRVIGFVDAKKRGETVLERPVFGTVKEAKKKTFCDVSVISVAPEAGKEAILEAIYAEVPLIIIFTDRIPLHDMVEVYQALKLFPKTRLLGPHSLGIISPRQAKVGFMPGYIYKEGLVGILSSSHSLLYEAALQTTKNDLGQSTCIIQGNYPLAGIHALDILELFYKDVATEAILVLGEIGVGQEEKIAEWLQTKTLKPFVFYLPGQSSEVQKRRRLFANAGAILPSNITELGAALLNSIKRR